MIDITDYLISVHEGLFGDLLTKNPNTFVARCELTNNALQAKAEETRTTLDLAPASKLANKPLERIVVMDNGCGVSKGEVGWKIMQSATDAKEGRRGVWRFAALQLCSGMEIGTVAYDRSDVQYRLAHESSRHQKRRGGSESQPAPAYA